MINRNGFTLTELVITIIILGILVGTGIPQYNKAIAKGHERDIVVQLSTIHSANEIYKASDGDYYNGSLANAGAISTTFGINVIENGAAYSYASAGGGATYTATGNWSGSFSIRVSEAPLEVNNSAPDNPCCSAGTCHTVAAC